MKDAQGEMIDILRGLDLVSPQRSTLGDGSVSAGVGFSVEETKRDLASLGWGECEVQSVRSFCSPTPSPPPEKMHGCSGPLPLCAAAPNGDKRGRAERTEAEGGKKIVASSGSGV